MRKYVDIVVDALNSKDKLFSDIFLYLMVCVYIGSSIMWPTQCLWRH